MPGVGSCLYIEGCRLGELCQVRNTCMAMSGGDDAETERLREALRYYADDAVYDSGDVPGHVYVLDDHGDTARVALGLPPRHKHPPSFLVEAEAWDGPDYCGSGT
jgi:hypothetical protein